MKKIIIAIILIIIIGVVIYLIIPKEKIPEGPLGDLTPVCGNDECERGEYDFNCCEDCGCENGYICKDNECIVDSSKITIKQDEAINIFKRELLKQGYIGEDLNETKITTEMIPNGYFICYDMATESMKKQGFVDMTCASVDNNKTISDFIRTI